MARSNTATFETAAGSLPRHGLSRVLIAVVFACGLVALVHLGTPSPGISTGDIAPRTIVARAPFEAIDIAETNERQQEARDRALSIYVDESNWKDAVRETLRAILEAVEEGDELDGVKSALRAKGIEVEPGPVWEVLREGGQVSREELLRSVAALVEEFASYGVIDDERMDEETRSGRQGIARRTPPVGVKVLAFAAPGVKGVLSESAARRRIAADLRAAYRGEDALAETVTRALQKDFRPSLTYNRGATRNAREGAASVVHDVTVSVQPGDVIVIEGRPVGPTEAEKILREAEAYYSSRPLREQILRVAGTAAVVGVVIAVLAWAAVRLEVAFGARGRFGTTQEALATTRAVFFVGLVNLIVVAVARGLVVAGLPVLLTPVALAGVVLALAVSPLFAGMGAVALAMLVAAASGPDLAVPATLAAGGVVGALTAARSRRRSGLLRAGAVAGVAQFAVIVGVKITTGVGDPTVLLRHGGWALLGGVGCGFASLGLLPLVEIAFGVTTDISLLELSDQNHPALRRLLTEAPGTYHHSLIVGNLSEAASTAVGANALLSRVASYYHDLGKVDRPEYFVENEPAGKSRHDGLSPTMSSLIITSHVRDGVALARHYGLPRAILDVIQQHHGTSLVEFFYRTALDRSGGETVDEHLFRYPGPRPQTREAGIVLVADSVEAASRALPSEGHGEPTSQRLTKLVKDIIMRRLLDGQFDECGLTFRELRSIRETFVKVLVSMFHARVPYPKASEREPVGGGAA